MYTTVFLSKKIHPAVSLTFCCGGQEAGCGEHRSHFVLNNNCSRADKVIAGLVVSVSSQSLVGSRQGLENSQGLPCAVPHRYPAALAGEGEALPVLPLSTKEGATPVLPRDSARTCCFVPGSHPICPAEGRPHWWAKSCLQVQGLVLSWTDEGGFSEWYRNGQAPSCMLHYRVPGELCH